MNYVSTERQKYLTVSLTLGRSKVYLTQVENRRIVLKPRKGVEKRDGERMVNEHRSTTG